MLQARSGAPPCDVNILLDAYDLLALLIEAA
jgi:hypothetical protein